MKALVIALVLAAAVATASADAAVGVRVQVSYEINAFFTEGYVWFASLDGARPKRVTAKSVFLPAKRGRHVLRVFIRPCDGNCSFLDPALQPCSKAVRAGQKVTYHLRENGCALTVRG